MDMNDNKNGSADLEARIAEMEKRLFVAENEARRANWAVLQLIKIYKQLDDIRGNLLNLYPFFLKNYGVDNFEQDLRLSLSLGISEDDPKLKETKEFLAIAKMLAGKK